MKVVNFLLKLRSILYTDKVSSYIFSLFMRLILFVSIISIMVYKGAKILEYQTIRPFFTIIEIFTISVIIIEFIINYATFIAVLIKKKEFSFKAFLNQFINTLFLANIIAMIPFYILPYPYTLLVVLARLLQFGRFSKKIQELLDVIKNSFYELTWFFTIFAFFLFVSSISIYIAESPYNPAFRSLFNAVWWSIVTATTVGYGDIVPITKTGKIIASFLMIFGIISIAMLTGIITSAFTRKIIESKLNKEATMQKKINELLNHYIICGFGKITSLVAEALKSNNQDFVIIEKDKDKANDAIDHGYLAVNADAADETVLMQTGIMRAKGIAILTNSDAENLYILMSAKELNKDIFAIARVNARENEEEAIKRFKRLGATTISPYHASATRVARMILAPHAADALFSIAGSREAIEIDEIGIPKGGIYDGKMIKQTNIRSTYNLMIIALAQEVFNPNEQKIEKKLKFNPSGDDIIDADTILICVGLSQDLQRFKKDIGST
ncbi:NAD-binding protein [Desulfurella amilsii]|nr:NAD-binding protein [Desulfurella amilsii]